MSYPTIGFNAVADASQRCAAINLRRLINLDIEWDNGRQLAT